MADRLRTFIAVDVDAFTRDRLVGLQERLANDGADARWVGRDNLHVTLLFLGEIDSREVPAVCRIVADVSATHPAFGMTLAGAGAFPTPRRPRTLIVHVTDGERELIALHDALEAPLLDHGCYRRENRPFKPHLTIGRVRGRADDARLTAAIRKFEAWQGGETRVQEVLVFSSQLRPDGPEYTILSRAPLKLR